MGNSASTAAPAVATAPVARRTYVCHWNDLRRGQLIGIGHSSCGMASAPRVFTHFGIFLGHNRQEHDRMEVEGPAVVHYCTFRGGGRQRRRGAFPTCSSSISIDILPLCSFTLCSRKGTHGVASQPLTNGCIG